jgi:hypothetical protein
MINKHEAIRVGVYWDDVGVPGWKMSGWLNTGATISYKICDKYNRSTLGVHDIYYVDTETGGQMRAVVYYSVRLRKSDRERARDLSYHAQIFSQ